MKYTEQDVERVAEAMFLAGNPLAGPDDLDDDDRTYYGGMASAALAAVAREPIKDAGILSLHVDRLGRTYYARGVRHRDNMTIEYSVTGATIDEAIRRAVEAAKGGE